MSRPTIAQCAGRALVLLLQNESLPRNAELALKELQRHELDFVEGAPELVEPAEPECFHQGCSITAVYQGWARKIDPFIGTPTGMTMSIAVCEDHKMSLIGFQEGKEPDNVTASH